MEWLLQKYDFGYATLTATLCEHKPETKYYHLGIETITPDQFVSLTVTHRLVYLTTILFAGLNLLC